MSNNRFKQWLLSKPILIKWAFNFWPPLFGTGFRITSVADDFSSIKVKLALHFYNKNYIGIHFGGSLFAMTDPFYTLLLSNHLGRGYLVCDKSASIEYRRMTKNDVVAEFSLSKTLLLDIKQQLACRDKAESLVQTDIIDEKNQMIIATVKRTLYIRKKGNKKNH